MVVLVVAIPSWRAAEPTIVLKVLPGAYLSAMVWFTRGLPGAPTRAARSFSSRGPEQTVLSKSGRVLAGGLGEQPEPRRYGLQFAEGERGLLVDVLFDDDRLEFAPRLDACRHLALDLLHGYAGDPLDLLGGAALTPLWPGARP